MKKFLILIFSFIAAMRGPAQAVIKETSDPYHLQYGFSVNARVEFAAAKGVPPALRLSGNFGLGSNFLSSWIYPSFNIETDLYTGGMGSRAQKFLGRPHDLDFVTALTLTAGNKNAFLGVGRRRMDKENIPLYYFSDHVYPALQNPFENSVSIGTNIVFTANPEKGNQRLGFFNLHANRWQVSYYNDGGVPISDIYLGDRLDRNYTGGGLLSYNGTVRGKPWLAQLSYQKFTGYSKNAFEVSNILYLNYMNYHNAGLQKRYNKSLINLSLANISEGWSVRLSSFNKIAWDLQHYIHWGISNSYHIVPYPAYWAISGSYNYSHTKIGRR